MLKKGWLERSYELIIENLSKVCRNFWAASEFDKKMSVTSLTAAHHYATIEGESMLLTSTSQL